MKLEHVALTITDPAEIKDFYYNILGMSEVKNFILEKALAREIFGIDKETSVFLLQKDELLLEIFILQEQYKQNFEHICISIKNREELIEKTAQNAYKYIRLNRKYADLIFIKDKSGNIFEIKESHTDPPASTREHGFGLFATRSPKRPNPIGLSTVKLDSINDGILHIRGIDAFDGTPVLDIKPYLPSVDCTESHQNEEVEKELGLHDEILVRDSGFYR